MSRNTILSVVTAGALLAGAAVEAALPPLYQSIKELYAIIRTPELPYHLTGADPIESIDKVANGWKISTRTRSVTAEIIYLPAQGPGPDRFTIKWIKD